MKTSVPISGKTRLIGVVADPIAHVTAPAMLNARLADAQIDAVVIPFHVGAGQLAATLQTLRHMKNLAGLLVTVPHKREALAQCQTATASAYAAGAVNVIRREPTGKFHGGLTDGDGFVGSLAAAGVRLDGRDVFLAGAGGAASAIALALAASKVARVTVANRSREKAEHLVGLLAARGGEAAIGTHPTNCALAINATSLGLRSDDPLPFDVDDLKADAVVADIVVGETNLLAAARRRGLKVHKGEAMLRAQLRAIMNHLCLPDA